jgi:hypothetical protein
MSKYVKKLGSDKTYKRPKSTFQEKLSADDIAEKLQGYEKVDDIADIPLNTHIRYFLTNPDGSQIFRLGGFLYNKQNPDKFVMLTNGKNVWSVQVNGTIFFRKLSQKDELEAVHALYKKKLAEKDEIIEKLKKYIKSKINNFDMNMINKNIITNVSNIKNNKKYLPPDTKISSNKNKSLPDNKYSNRISTKNISNHGSKTRPPSNKKIVEKKNIRR